MTSGRGRETAVLDERDLVAFAAMMIFASPSWTQCHSKQLRLGGVLALAGAVSCLHLIAISALFSTANVVVVDDLAGMPTKSVLYHTAKDIVYETYRTTYSHLERCPNNRTMQDCASDTYNLRAGRNFPWWFQSMLRDSTFDQYVHAFWHDQSAPNVLDNGKGIRMCAIEKIGIKQFKEVFYQLQNNITYDRANCRPKLLVPSSAPKFVFLRDQLERFVSVFIDKCLRSTRKQRESHCEPVQVFEHDEHGLTKGLLDSNRTFFEAYVQSGVPLKWNMHFFPQR